MTRMRTYEHVTYLSISIFRTTHLCFTLATLRNNWLPATNCSSRNCQSPTSQNYTCARSMRTRSSSRRLFLLSSGQGHMRLPTAWYLNIKEPFSNRFVARIYSSFLCRVPLNRIITPFIQLQSPHRCSTISHSVTPYFFSCLVRIAIISFCFISHMSQLCICFSSAIDQIFFFSRMTFFQFDPTTSP